MELKPLKTNVQLSLPPLAAECGENKEVTWKEKLNGIKTWFKSSNSVNASSWEVRRTGNAIKLFKKVAYNNPEDLKEEELVVLEKLLESKRASLHRVKSQAEITEDQRYITDLQGSISEDELKSAAFLLLQPNNKKKGIEAKLSKWVANLKPSHLEFGLKTINNPLVVIGIHLLSLATMISGAVLLQWVNEILPHHQVLFTLLGAPLILASGALELMLVSIFEECFNEEVERRKLKHKAWFKRKMRE